MNKFIIDAPTAGAKTLVKRLSNLKTTYAIEYRGTYTEDPSACQVYVETKWTEDELDHWLWKSKGVSYLGVAALEAQ